MPDLKLVIDEASLQADDVVDNVNFQIILASNNIYGHGPDRSFKAFIQPGKEIMSLNLSIKELENEIKHHDKNSAPIELVRKNKALSECNKKLQKQKDIDEKDQKNIAWIWSAFSGKPNFSNNNDIAAIQGSKAVKLVLSKVYEGGGLTWLEPFYKQNNPANTAPNGWFISLKGKPKILSAQWRELNYKNEGARIADDTSKKFNQKVQLHIYTEGLFGQDIEVMLMDKDLVDPDDHLSIKDLNKKYQEHNLRVERENKIKAQKEDERSEIKYEATAGEIETVKREDDKNRNKNDWRYFTVPVDVFTLFDDEQTDSLKDIGNNAGKKMIISEATEKIMKVQKSVLTVYLDPVWGMGKNEDGDNAGKHLKVFPLVRVLGSTNDFKPLDAYLNVDIEGDTLPAFDLDGNSPVVTGTIKTNASDFNPCKYSKIQLTIDAKQEIENKKRDVILYDGVDNHTNDVLKNSTYIELVVGAKDYGKTITISLEDTAETLSCRHAPLHTNNVINIVNLLNKYEQDELKNPKKEKLLYNFQFTDPNFTYAQSKLLDAQNESNQKLKELLPFIKRDYVTDNKVVIEVSYPYPEIPNEDRLALKMFDYIMPNSTSISYPTLEIPIQTCRLTRIVKLKLYPDIKFSLGFAIKSKTQQKADKQKEKEDKVNHVGTSVKMRKIEEALNKLKYNTANNGVKKAQKLVLKLGIPRNLVNKANLRTQAEREAEGSLEVEVQLMAEYNQIQGDENFLNSVDFIKTLKEKFEGYLKEIEFLWVLIERYTHGPDNTARSNNNLLKKMKDAMVRKVVDYDIEYPKMELYGTWQKAEGNTPRAKELYKDYLAGYMLHLGFKFAPLIGIKVKLDGIALIEKIHPFVRAVVSIVEEVGLILADLKMDLSLEVTGELGFTVLDFFYNTLTGENTFNTKDVAHKNSSYASSEQKIEFVFNASITGSMNIPIFYIYEEVSDGTYHVSTSAEVDGYASFSAKGSFTLAQELKYSDGRGEISKTGLYIDGNYHFNGLKISYGADFKVVYRNEKDKSQNEEKDKNILVPKHEQEVYKAQSPQNLFKWFFLD